MELSWYALQSKPNKESQLLRGLEASGFEAWYPSYRVKPVNPRSRKIRPLFPRYLFVRIDLGEQPVSTFTWMANAIGLVSFGDVPAPVPDRLIEVIRERLREMTNVLGYAEEFKPGDRVRVTSGPFRDYEAVVDLRLSGVDRVRVLLDIMRGRSMAVQMDMKHLKRV